MDAPLFVRSGWSYMTADDYAYSIDAASAAAGVRANDSVRATSCCFKLLICRIPIL